MATITRGKTFTSGETVEPADMHQLVDNATITGIVNSDFAGSVGLNSWSTKTGNYTATAGDRISADTALSSFTITLPSSPATYTEVTLADHSGSWGTNNLTVARNGSNINGLAEDLTCDAEGKQILLRHEGATVGWRIYT